MNPCDNSTMSPVQLDIGALRVTGLMVPSLRNTWVRVEEDPETRRLIVQLEKRMATKETVEASELIAYPADWWQAFKNRWYPTWMQTLWPVRWTEVQLLTRVVRMCPHIELPAGSREHINWLLEEKAP